MITKSKTKSRTSQATLQSRTRSMGATRRWRGGRIFRALALSALGLALAVGGCAGSSRGSLPGVSQSSVRRIDFQDELERNGKVVVREGDVLYNVGFTFIQGSETTIVVKRVGEETVELELRGGDEPIPVRMEFSCTWDFADPLFALSVWNGQGPGEVKLGITTP